MKSVKISRNVIHGGKILKAGQVHELEEKDAKLLIDGEHAAEHTADEKPADDKKDEGGAGDGKEKGKAKK